MLIENPHKPGEPVRRPSGIAVMPEFGEFLQRLRDDRKMTQSHLASMAAVSVATISRFERGVLALARHRNLAAIAQAIHAVKPLDPEENKRYWNLLDLPAVEMPQAPTVRPVNIEAEARMTVASVLALATENLTADEIESLAGAMKHAAAAVRAIGNCSREAAVKAGGQ